MGKPHREEARRGRRFEEIIAFRFDYDQLVIFDDTPIYCTIHYNTSAALAQKEAGMYGVVGLETPVAFSCACSISFVSFAHGADSI